MKVLSPCNQGLHRSEVGFTKRRQNLISFFKVIMHIDKLNDQTSCFALARALANIMIEGKLFNVDFC
jgi:hypothetical protein